MSRTTTSTPNQIQEIAATLAKIPESMVILERLAEKHFAEMRQSEGPDADPDHLWHMVHRRLRGEQQRITDQVLSPAWQAIEELGELMAGSTGPDDPVRPMLTGLRRLTDECATLRFQVTSISSDPKVWARWNAAIDEFNALIRGIVLHEPPALETVGGEVDEQPKKRGSRIEWQAKAMDLINKHPHWTKKRIAEEVGVNRSQLSEARSPEVHRAFEIAREAEQSRAPKRGFQKVDPVTGDRQPEAYSD